jgi:hypothetical protein
VAAGVARGECGCCNAIQLEMSSGLGLGFGFYWLLGACAFFNRFLAFFFSSEILEDLIHGSNN